MTLYRRLSFFAAVLLASVCVVGRVRAGDEKQITLAAYNVEFMLDVFDDPYAADEGRPPKPRKDIEAVCKALRAVNADVVSFTELENEGVLRQAVEDFLPDMGYRYITADTSNSGRGQNLGIISRKPIVSLTSHRFQDLKLPGDEQTWRFARDLWQVRIQATPTTTLDIFIVHLKSKYDSPDDPNSHKWRLAEATAARRIIGQAIVAHPGSLVAMVGDFNDEPDSATLKELLTPGDDKKPLLIDAHAGLDDSERITYLRPPYRSTVDYILVSPELSKRLIPRSARVLADDSLLEGSDHAPIWASFKLSDN